ncbi:MAG: alanine racemase [Clostridiales bacterium]|nr:alanine racemase [Clostridiales bacterium]
MDHSRLRCWAEISLDNIEHNYREIRKKLPEGCRFTGIVKADAYGHGAVPVSRRLEAAGADYLAVSFIDEALTLREAGIKLPILILGHSPENLAPELIKYDITQTVVSLEAAKAYSNAAAGLGAKLKCHLKLDSGMGRFGFMGKDAISDIITALNLDNLYFEGIFTHFAVSDIADTEYTRLQYDIFADVCSKIEDETGKHISIKHCANSGAMINYPWTYADMVRPGIALYGCSPGAREPGFSLRPCMTLKTRISQIKQIPTGASVSYGRTWKAQRPSRIAVLAIGYADGLFRALSDKASVLVRKTRVPLIGRICMDLVMADVTDLPQADVGDEVIVFGESEGCSISVEELSTAAGTIPYELLCAVSARVPRVY